MNNPVKNVSVLKIARNMGDVAITALEVYKTILSVKFFAADSLLKTVKLVKNNTAKPAPSAKAQSNPDTNPNNTENVKENTSMKKSTFWALIAFLAAVCAAIAGVAYYLKKREAELEEYDDMLFNEDYLADYMPKDEEGCFDDCCCEDTSESEQTQETSAEDVIEF